MGEYVIITTSHDGESVADVVAFAEVFETRVPHAVKSCIGSPATFREGPIRVESGPS